MPIWMPIWYRCDRRLKTIQPERTMHFNWNIAYVRARARVFHALSFFYVCVGVAEMKFFVIAKSLISLSFARIRDLTGFAEFLM